MSHPASALLDPVRLRVAAALMDRPMQVDQLCDAVALPRPTALAAIGELRTAGLVVQEGDRFVLPARALRDLARSLAATPEPMDPFIGYGMDDDERTVLTRFFEGRRLTNIPVDRSKRLVVLQRLALEFDVGRRYDENAVNETLRGFHDDYATLRRSLVDEELLDREHVADDRTQYWRSGGRVQPLPRPANRARR